MTPVADRATVVSLIDEAVNAGAGLMKARNESGIDRRTLHRWLDRSTGGVRADRRPKTLRPMPSNAFGEEESQIVSLACQLPHFVDLPPSQIVPTLADQGV